MGIQIKAELPESARAVVDSFIALDSDSGAPEAAGYEAQSGGIIDMLEKMRLKFEDQRLGLEKSEITTLADDIAAIKGQQADAQGIRDTEKAKNQETISDAKVAQAAVEKAMQVLKDFYAKAESSSLIQGTNGLEQEMAQASRAPYKGMASGGGNLVDFLDVILSDFARLESETTTAEDTSLASHEKFMNEALDDVALKETEQEHKEGKRDSTTELNRNLKKELKLTQEELDAALKYYDELKPDCLDMGLSYADRKAQREEEIQSSKEALKMFE